MPSNLTAGNFHIYLAGQIGASRRAANGIRDTDEQATASESVAATQNVRYWALAIIVGRQADRF